MRCTGRIRPRRFNRASAAGDNAAPHVLLLWFHLHVLADTFWVWKLTQTAPLSTGGGNQHSGSFAETDDAKWVLKIRLNQFEVAKSRTAKVLCKEILEICSQLEKNIASLFIFLFLLIYLFILH